MEGGYQGQRLEQGSSYAAICHILKSNMAWPNPQVRILEGVVEKYVDDPVCTARKYTEVHRIGAMYGFLAPRVLDVRSNWLVLERIHGLVSIRDLYLSAHSALVDHAVRRAGEVLALLHRELPTANTLHWKARPDFESAFRRFGAPLPATTVEPSAVLHGDYSFANVFITVDAPQQVVVIDPCANGGSTFDDWTKGPIYVDIGKMLACLEGQVSIPNQLKRPSVDRVNLLQRQFVDSYQSVGSEIDLGIAHSFAYAAAATQYRRRYGRASNIHQTILYNRFRGNFPLHRKLDVVGKLTSSS